MKTQKKYCFGYFYASSPLSEKFKMPKGGYYVAEFEHWKPGKPIKAFKTEKEAKEEIKRLWPNPRLHVQHFLQGCSRPYIVRDENGNCVSITYSKEDAYMAENEGLVKA